MTNDELGEQIYLISVPTFWATIIGIICHSWLFLGIWWAIFVSLLIFILVVHMKHIRQNRKNYLIETKGDMTSLLDELELPSDDEWYDAQWQSDYLNAMKELEYSNGKQEEET
jgi:hypothetical protein